MSDNNTAPKKCQALHVEHQPELLHLLQEITCTRHLHNFNDAAVSYYRVIPRLVERSFLGNTMNMTVFNRQRKKYALQDKIFVAAFEQIGNWPVWDSNKAHALIAGVFPALLGICSLSRHENLYSCMNCFFSQMAKQCGENHIRILSPLCPSYQYRKDRNGLLWHSSGELLPAAGEHFEKVLNTLATTLAPLIQCKLVVDWNFWSYSGETRKDEHLADIAYFVKEHYARFPGALCDILNQAYQDTGRYLSDAGARYGIRFAQQSFDKQFGLAIHSLYEDFAAGFPDAENTVNSPIMRNWLCRACGTDLLLNLFIVQESIYRKNIQLNFREPLAFAALREMLLYTHLLQYAQDHRQIILDTESTSNYMNIAAPLFSAGILFAKKDRNEIPHDKFTQNLRQPYTVR